MWIDFPEKEDEEQSQEGRKKGAMRTGQQLCEELIMQGQKKKRNRET